MRSLAGMDTEMGGIESMDVECMTDSLEGGKTGLPAGHQIPGVMMLLIGLWWAVNIFSQQLTLGKKTFKCRAWQPFPMQSLWLFEPTLKVLFMIIGVIMELFLQEGVKYRKLYDDYGYFCIRHLNNWQHITIYIAFGFSGLVDILSADGNLPKNLDTGVLAVAFFIFGELMVFHLKGSTLEVRVHVILVLCVFYTLLTVLGEMRSPDSFMMSCAKCHAMMLTGSWMFHIGNIIFGGNTAWDEDSMGGTMFAPVVFGAHILAVTAVMVLLYIFMLRTNFVIVPRFQEREEGEQNQFESKAGNQD